MKTHRKDCMLLLANRLEGVRQLAESIERSVDVVCETERDRVKMVKALTVLSRRIDMISSELMGAQ